MTQTGPADLGTNWFGPTSIDNDLLYYATNNGRVVEYSISLRSFTIKSVGTCADLVSVLVTDDWLFAGDVDGVIHSSSDFGVTWNSTDLNDGSVVSLSAASASTIIIGTGSGTVHSFDAQTGTSIVLLHDGNSDLLWVNQLNSLITAVFRKGTFIQSTDNGRTWNAIVHDSVFEVTGAYRYDDTTIVLGGHLASVYLSRDNLRTVNRCTPIKRYPEEFANAKLDDITVIQRSGDRLIVAGTLIPDRYVMGFLYDSVFYSDDLGTTWNSRQYPASALSIDLSQPLTLFATDSVNLVLSIHNKRLGAIGIYSSTDNADTWRCDTTLLTRMSSVVDVFGSPYPLTNQFSDLVSSKESIYSLARRGVEGINNDFATDLLISVDKGTSWSRLYQFSQRCVSSFVTDDTVYVGSATGTIYRSIDKGETFPDSLMIDSSRTSDVMITDMTSESQVILYSSKTRKTDTSASSGVIYLLDADLGVRELNLERDGAYNRLSPPITNDGVIYALYAHTDTNSRLTVLYLLTWRNKIEKSERLDISAVLAGRSALSARLYFVDSESIWLSIDNIPVQLSRSSFEPLFHDQTIDGSIVSKYGILRKIIATPAAKVCVMQTAVLVKTAESQPWSLVARCGTTDGINFGALDILALSQTEFLVSSSPYLYLLRVPNVNSVWRYPQRTAASTVAKYVVGKGSALVLPFTTDAGIVATTVGGQVTRLNSVAHDSRLVVDTNSLAVGLYVITSADNKNSCMVLVKDTP